MIWVTISDPPTFHLKIFARKKHAVNSEEGPEVVSIKNFKDPQ